MTDHQDQNALAQLARHLVNARRVKPNLTGTSTDAGRRDDEVRVRGLPMPLGDVGEVLLIAVVDGDVVAAWGPAPGAAADSYRQYVVVSDGSGGFALIDDGAGNPVYSLEATE